MGDFEPPSFSLGFDFDTDSEPESNAGVGRNLSSDQVRDSPPTCNFSTVVEVDEDECDPPTSVSDPPRPLKRLRRGPTPTAPKRRFVESCNADDDIEVFSSEEDLCRNKVPLAQNHSVWSRSKFPLHVHETLIVQSENQSKNSKKEVLNFPVSAKVQTSSSKSMIQDLEVSPIRRFELIESDSDDSFVAEVGNTKASHEHSSLTEMQSCSGQHEFSNEHGRNDRSTPQKDLWEDFHSDQCFSIPTPALDEFCKEYFRPAREKLGTSNNNNNNSKNSIGDDIVNKGYAQQWDLSSPPPPSHLYFFHDDPKIQRLVRSRLPNFFPLAAVNDHEHDHLNTSNVDYMNQFNHGEGSKPASEKTNKSGARRSKALKRSDIETQVSGSWVNPKSSSENPKDAGKRRVHAVGQSAGRWYTSDGKKVYVSKTGRELTGRVAYTHYKKESVMRFKKSKKKTTSKKKAKAVKR